MAEIIKERASNENVEKAINELIMREENSGFLKGEFKGFIEELAKKYDVSHYTLKNRYYTDIKGKVKQSNVAKKRIANATVLTKEKKGKTTKKDDSDMLFLIDQATDDKLQGKNKKEEKVKETPKSPINVDESIQKHIEKEPIDKMFKYPKDYYRVGQLVDVKVLNLQTYGAFCEIIDGRGFQALCHISEITNSRIKKVQDYLEVGDVIPKARIILIEDKRINLTVKHLNLSKREQIIENYDTGEVKIAENPPVTLAEKFGNIKEQLMAKAVENNTESKEVENKLQFDTSEKEINEIFAIEEESKKQEEIVQKYDRDIQEMTSYLSSQLGALSTQAKVELAKLIDEEGVFRTTRTLMKTQEDFKADLGLLFVQQMKEKMSEYL